MWVELFLKNLNVSRAYKFLFGNKSYICLTEFGEELS